eukprot:6928486-Lingulodinium_polyedra.AAC.1
MLGRSTLPFDGSYDDFLLNVGRLTPIGPTQDFQRTSSTALADTLLVATGPRMPTLSVAPASAPSRHRSSRNTAWTPGALPWHTTPSVLASRRRKA